MSFYGKYPPTGGGGAPDGILSINGDTTQAQLIVGGTGISVGTAAGTTTITNTAPAPATGNLTDVGTDGIVITGGTGAVIGSGTSIAQHVADSTHNGYLSSTDWSTFNGKQDAVSFGTFGSSPNSAGGSISAGVITLQPASGTQPGGVSTASQTFAGDKTFSGVIFPSNGSVSAPGVAWNTNFGLYFASTKLNVAGGGKQAQVIDGNGLVGFGPSGNTNSNALVTVGAAAAQTVLSGTTQGAARFEVNANSSATSYNIAALFQVRSDNSSFTTGFASGLYENALSKGASNTISRYAGIRFTPTTAATNNASIADNEAYVGNYFIHQSGTVASVLGGALTMGGNIAMGNNAITGASSVGFNGVTTTFAPHVGSGGLKETSNSSTYTFLQIENTSSGGPYVSDLYVYGSGQGNKVGNLTIGNDTNDQMMFCSNAHRAGIGIGNAADGYSGQNLTTLTVGAWPDKTATGTTTVNASTTVTGSSTLFLTQIAVGDQIAVSSASSTFANVTAVASNTSLTVDTALGNGTTQTISVRRAIARFDDRSANVALLLDPDSNAKLSGNLSVITAGKGLRVKEGSNATMGTATLSGGTATVNTTVVTANSRILLTAQSLGTIIVPAALAVSARSAGTSFTILSSDATDTSVVAWLIMEPA